MTDSVGRHVAGGSSETGVFPNVIGGWRRGALARYRIGSGSTLLMRFTPMPAGYA